MRKRWQKVALCAAGGFVAAGLTFNAYAADDAAKAEDEGVVIQVGPEGTGDEALPAERAAPQGLPGGFQQFMMPGGPGGMAMQSQPVSPYYIGIAAMPVGEALRSHVNLEDGVGLLVQGVFEGSPADESGFEPHDILVSADGKTLHELADLVAVVDSHAGDEMRAFDVEIIRHGQPQTVSVTPANRPESAVVEPQQGFGGVDPQILDRLRQLPQGFGNGNAQVFRMPGLNLDQVPGNVSVQVHRDADGTSKVTVQRGEEKWEVVADDPDSLAKLPEDLRPMVEGMLNGNPGGGMFDMNADLPEDLQQRLQQMEEQMKKMQEQMLDKTDASRAEVER
jgi:membrane-associated protease RseP (regulator of RpoE activity)